MDPGPPEPRAGPNPKTKEEGAQVATGTTVFSRVTVVAPKTRIDLALPADVSVADLLPMLLDMAHEGTADGGARHGGGGPAKLGGDRLGPSPTPAPPDRESGV